MVTVRRIRADEGQQLKALRIRALGESPDAFGSTQVDALGEPDACWAGRAAEDALSGESIIVIAYEGVAWLGMARAHFEDPDESLVELTSLWVEPSRRGSGIATSLCDALVVWAKERGARRLQLWVTETNVEATRLYARLGFVATGERQPVRPGSCLREVQMVRDV